MPPALLFTSPRIMRPSLRSFQQLPVLDFLVPSLASSGRHLRVPASRIHTATAAAPASIEHEQLHPPPAQAHPSSPLQRTTHQTRSFPQASQHGETPKRALTQEQRDFLDSALRVNQAGELAAVLIYTAQTPPLVKSHPHLRPLLQHMHDQEAGHFSHFNALLSKHRIRPTLMYPVWKAAATALGWGTAVMGREAAMACTEAVETEIGGHYNEQIRVLIDWAEKMERRGQGVGEEMQALLTDLRRIRDEELEHLDHAVDNDAKAAEPYELLTNVIRGGCRTAIWISERV